jgi:hypothetical protein
MTLGHAVIERQLDAIVDDYVAMQKRSAYDDLSDLPEEERQALVTRAVAAVRRIAGRTSTDSQETDRLLKQAPALHVHTPLIVGVVRGLRADVGAGYLASLTELIHADLFADFLEMAEHLSREGYKDAAAVIAGSSLEAHLRQLCQKNSISPDSPTGSGPPTPKKADRLNSELAAAGVDSKLDQKNVTAWLGLRNKAAHGRYAEYDTGQVGLLIAAVRDFVSRTPA